MSGNDLGKKSGKTGASNEFTAVSLVWRLLFALFMVLVTYNPSGYSVFHWVRTAMSEDSLGAMHFFVGTLLLIGWSILVIAMWRAMGTFGVARAALAIGTLVWLLIDIGLLAPDTTSGIAWLVLICLAGLLSIGLPWSHIWHRLTGRLKSTAMAELYVTFPNAREQFSAKLRSCLGTGNRNSVLFSVPTAAIV